jgi:hypothetical protein
MEIFKSRAVSTGHETWESFRKREILMPEFLENIVERLENLF